MEKSIKKILAGYDAFKSKYAQGDESVMNQLSAYGQKPEIMVLSCCDSRVDPAVILQCDPGDLFVVRNVANIVPPFELDEAHHGTSAALEFAVKFLQIKNLILLGHSQCAGIQALLDKDNIPKNDFISNWVSLIESDDCAQSACNVDDYAKKALHCSYKNCMTFPWIAEKVNQGELRIHLWFFNVKKGEIYSYSAANKDYVPLDFASAMTPA